MADIFGPFLVGMSQCETREELRKEVEVLSAMLSIGDPKLIARQAGHWVEWCKEGQCMQARVSGLYREVAELRRLLKKYEEEDDNGAN